MATEVELNLRGLELDAIADFDGARLHYLAALRLNPNFGPALANLASISARGWDRNQKEVAIAMMRRILAIAPQDGNQWNNLGTMLMQLERYGEAQVAMDNARKYSPDSPATWHNLGLLCLRTQRYEEGLEYLDRVVELGKGIPSLHNDRAHAYLALGKLDVALEIYENRWASLRHLPPWDFRIPEWRGESLENRRILFHAEQGFGDTIMCSRFVRQLFLKGANVTLGVPPNLVRLFEHQEWPGDVANILEMPDDSRERWDFQSPMYSAMRHLGLAAPSDIDSEPYLKAPQVSSPAVDKRFFTVGICWASGSRGGEMDWRRRATSLKSWLRLAENPAVRLHSLQKGAGEEEVYSLQAEALIEDATQKLADWADTAAYIAKLDLIISVDTAVAHLAGALGKPTWMLSQFSNCWRWWDISGKSGGPWYSTMRIIPARKPDDWDAQLAEAAASLTDVVESRSRELAA